MDILVGRGGNQNMAIKDPEIGAIHFELGEVEDLISISILSYKPTYVNGQRVVGYGNLFERDAVLTAGSSLNLKLSELLDTGIFDYKLIQSWSEVINRFSRSVDIDVFLNCCIENENEKDTLPVIYMKMGKAYLLIEENKLREAQILIYEIGDILYSLQDGSETLKTAYLGIFIPAYLLYKKAGLADMAQATLDCINSMEAQGVKFPSNTQQLIS